jgi:hypothetical protein
MAGTSSYDVRAMRRVIIESPYAGDVARNLAYVRACMADCLRRGETPLASHALYTQPGVLNDDDPGERSLGLWAGWYWLEVADAQVFYIDLGMSRGMRMAETRGRTVGVKQEYREMRVDYMRLDTGNSSATHGA